MTVDVGRLDAALRAAGVSFGGVSTSNVPGSFAVTSKDGVTLYVTGLQALQQSLATSTAGATNVGARVPRTVAAILTDVIAIPTAQQTAIWSDLTGGSPPKWRTTSSDPCVWAKASQPSTLTLLEKQVAVAFYCRENPRYLDGTSWGTPAVVVNVPGDQAAP